MRNFCTYLVASLLLLSPCLTHGQGVLADRVGEGLDRAPSLSALMKEAARAASVSDYYTAMQRYAQVLEVEPLNVTALAGYGDAAVRFSALDSAEVVYERMLDNKLSTPSVLPLLRLADVKYRKGDYPAAKDLYYRFLFTDKPAGSTPAMIEEAEKRMEDCDWAITHLKNPTFEGVSFELMDTTTINTKEYSEFSPFPLEDSLYFSAYRFPFEKDKNYPKRNLIKVLSSSAQADRIVTTQTEFNQDNRHTAHLTFNEGGDIAVYSVGNFVGDVDIRSELWMRRRNADDTWSSAQLLPSSINIPGYTSTQASIGKLPGIEYPVLFYVSDRPGGKGQRDVWYTVMKGNEFSEPENLAALNTKGDDVTPFYHNQSNTLYYSTEGLQTLGGFDVFKSKRTESGWEEPKNIGAPFNSSFNDVYYVLTPTGKTAFMSSNRRGDYNASEEGCCYDLYKAEFAKPQMIAYTLNKENKLILPYTNLTLFEVDAKGKPVGPGQTVKLDESGSYRYDLLPGRNYMLVGTKDRFSPDTTRFSTPNRIWREEIVQKLYLNPGKINLIATIYDKKTLEPIPAAAVRFIDIGQVLPNGNLAQGKGGAPLAIKEDTHEKDNKYEYPLEFEHRYKIVASKPGYTIDSTGIVSTEGLDGSTTIEKKLYIYRGIEFKAHALNNVNRDTLRGVTFRLIEVPNRTLESEYVNPLNRNFDATVAFDKRYLVIASKDGYSTDSVEFSTRNLKLVSFNSIQRELRLRPLFISAYLPIKLFFDNDEPDKRTVAKQTKREYRATYFDYYNRKADFTTRYTTGMTGEETERATADFDNFFEKDVRGGWEKLMQFSEVLLEMLQQGDKIEITLTGFASPRAASNYNMSLTSRRVSSVLNHFLLFDGGVYKPYVLSGQLIIKEAPRGETEAQKSVSDAIKDERNSVFSVPASRERRLEIIGVEVNKQKK
jgi:hypothetical protein